MPFGAPRSDMAFSDPKLIISKSGIAEGSTVADFGAGSGHYTLAAARAVGARGRVYAVDIQKDLLARLRREASAQEISNIEVVWGDAETSGGTKLKDASVDTVILANTLFQMNRRAAAVEEIKRVLIPGGKALIVEWKDSFGGLGPRPADIVSEQVARELFERAGFTFERSIPETGEHHYAFIVKKA